MNETWTVMDTNLIVTRKSKNKKIEDREKRWIQLFLPLQKIHEFESFRFVTRDIFLWKSWRGMLEEVREKMDPRTPTTVM